MRQRRLPKWASDLPKAAQDHLRAWMNPAGWCKLGKPRGRLRRAQDALIRAGLMTIDPDNDQIVRLTGKAAAMRSL